jgi:hypothetical protein
MIYCVMQAYLKETSELLIFSDSYQFTMMHRVFSNSQILDKKKLARAKAATPFTELLQRLNRH